MPDIEQLIRSAGLEGWILQGRRYPHPLPEGLRNYYCYTRDGGHSLLVVLEKEYRYGESPERYVVPAPIRMVLRSGYREKDGYLWSDLPYTKDLGLQVRDEDIEF
ncbi:MAG: hypothetical protein A4E38_00521 [Methanoregulaceae archaeon PtaB.Bin108]|nr:MAG: hypothetical protein A4E38_00521 [Methanoregulaceae archaeon PtaB.Bin108]